jgi:tRNA threonylcarbamoyl adenosine modification protein YeaZ
VSHDSPRRAILAIDTATTQIVIASGSTDGELDAVATWAAGYRHGETLLPAIASFLVQQNLRRSQLVGIVVGTGPGAFTGLRVGIATAKGLAHGLALPIAGVSTGEALLSAARAAALPVPDRPGADPGDRPVLLVPAGPNDRVLVRHGDTPRLLPGGVDPELAPGEWIVAVDLDGRAPDAAVARGELAREGLGAALIEMGARRLRAGSGDDLAALVPEYVSLPRGTIAQTGEVAWSRDPR